MRIVTILIMTLAIYSCQSTSVEGRVYNPITGQGVTDTEIRLTSDSNIGYNSTAKLIKIIDPDPTGYFSHTFNASSSKSYQIRLDFDQSKYFAYKGWSHSILQGQSNVLDFELIPYSYLKLKINNVNCQGSNDTLILNQADQLSILDDGSYDWYHIGCINWETTGYSDIPMGYYYYHWEVIRNGNSQHFYDTLYLQAGDSLIYEINY